MPVRDAGRVATAAVRAALAVAHGMSATSISSRGSSLVLLQDHTQGLRFELARDFEGVVAGATVHDNDFFSFPSLSDHRLERLCNPFLRLVRRTPVAAN